MLAVESSATPPELMTEPAFDLKPGVAVDLTIPGDPPRDDSAYWFVDISKKTASASDSKDPLWMPPARAGNEVMYLLDGQDTYNAMADALETVTGIEPGSFPKDTTFIYMCNWWINFDFNLKRTDAQTSEAGTTLRDYLNSADRLDTMIRGIFWERTDTEDSDQNPVEANYISKLNNGYAYLDGKHNWVGSHHQKLLLINGSEGLIAFVGGIDFNYDRIFSRGQNIPSPEGDLSNPGVMKTHELGPEELGAPWRDAHVRLRGPAAYDMLDMFLRRYADHFKAMGKTILAPHQDLRPRAGQHCYARVGTTFGDNPSEQGSTYFVPDQATIDAIPGPASPDDPPTQLTITGKSIDMISSVSPYFFAPKGRKSGFAQLLYGINSARKFVYFEDQYMVSEEIAAALQAAVKRGVAVIGVIPHQSISTDFDHFFHSDVLGAARRSRFIEVIYGAGAKPTMKPFLFCPTFGDGPGGIQYRYIHSKLFICDDAFCTIGSMNNNKRSTTHDSELCVGYYEPGGYDQLTFGFAHRLRMRRWAQHLGLYDQDTHLLADPLEAIEKYWTPTLENESFKIPGDTDDVFPNVVMYSWEKDESLGDKPAATTETNHVFDPGNDNALRGLLPDADVKNGPAPKKKKRQMALLP